MMKLDPTMSKPRWLTLIVSLAGLVLLAILWWRVGSDHAERTAGNYLLLSLPFVFALIVSTAPMTNRARIVYLWIVSLFTGMVAALTIFGGVGFFYLIAVVIYLAAAWMLNESGEPTMLHRRGDIITNPRIRPRA